MIQNCCTNTLEIKWVQVTNNVLSCFGSFSVQRFGSYAPVSKTLCSAKLLAVTKEPNLSCHLFIVTFIKRNPIPAGGAGEVGPVIDWWDRLVHEWVRFDERQGVVWEGGGRLVGSRRALTGAASRPAQQQRKKTHRHWIHFHGHGCKSTGSCLFLGMSGREKQIPSRTACFCFVFLFKDGCAEQ